MREWRAKEPASIAKRIIEGEVAEAGYKVEKVILFGSRARRENTRASDWDFLAVVGGKMGRKERLALVQRIRRKLAKLGIDADIILKSREEFEEQVKDVGMIAYYAAKEGVAV